MKKTFLILITLGLLDAAQAGEMGMTLQQLHNRFGRDEGGSADGHDISFRVNGWYKIFCFDPDGTVGQINLWKEASDLHTQPFTAQEIRSLLNKASGVTWTQTANTLKLENDFGEDFLKGDLQFIGVQNNKPVFQAVIARDLRSFWVLDIETIR